MRVSGLILGLLVVVKMDQFSMTINSNTTNSADAGVSISPDTNGGYLLVAQFQDYNDKTLVATLDSQGIRQNHIILDGPSDILLSTVAKTPNGNYLVGTVDINKLTLMELNDNLQIQQKLQLQAGSATEVLGVAQRADGEIMALTTAIQSNYYRIYVVRISSAFVVQQQFFIGGSTNDRARAVTATQDNGFLVVASYGPINLLVKYNSANGVDWGATWNGVNSQLIYNAIQLSNSNFFFAGTESNSSPVPFIVVLTDSAGNIILQKSFAHSTTSVYIYGITESADGKLFLTGRMDAYCIIAKMDNSLNLEWTKYYDFGSNFAGYSIARAATGNGVVLTGKANVGNGQDIIVMEVDSDGLLTSSAGTYYPTSISLTQSSINFSVLSTSGLPTTQSYTSSNEGIQILDLEVQQSFQYPSGREGSSYVPGTSSGDSGSSAGLIAGVVVGILIVAAAIIIIVCCCKRKNKPSSSTEQTPSVQKQVMRKESQVDEKSPIALNTTYPDPPSYPQSFVQPTQNAPPPQVAYPQPGFNQYNGNHNQVLANTPHVQPPPITTPQYQPQPLQQPMQQQIQYPQMHQPIQQPMQQPMQQATHYPMPHPMQQPIQQPLQNAPQPQPMAVPGVNNQPFVPAAPVQPSYAPGVQPVPGQNYSSVPQSGQPYVPAPPTYMAQPGIQ